MHVVHDTERYQNLRQIYVTDHSEYHVHGNRCVAVFSLLEQAWKRQHAAIDGELLGGLQITRDGAWLPHMPTPILGDKLIFSNDVITSPLRHVRRVTGSQALCIVAGESAIAA